MAYSDLSSLLGINTRYEYASGQADPHKRMLYLESFIELYPTDKNGDYEDAPHIRYYRSAIYDLLKCYHIMNKDEKFDKWLKWLKENDENIK